MNNYFIKFILIFIIATAYNCTTTKHLPKDNFLQWKNNIIIELPLAVKSAAISKYDLQAIAKPEVHKKLLGFYPYKLAIYDAFSGGNTTQFTWWMQNKLGESYKLFDSMAVNRAKIQMKNYLFNTGFYNAQVTTKTVFKHKKAVVNYIIKPHEQCIINQITFEAENDTIKNIINEYVSESFLKIGEVYNVLKIKAERERLEILLRNAGYYFFSQEYVYIDVDTSLNNQPNSKQFINKYLLQNNLLTIDKRPINLKIGISNPENDYHKVFTIGNVFIYTDYKNDSTINYNLNDSIHFRNYIVYSKTNNLSPSVLTNNTFVEKGQAYSFEKQLATVNRLASFSYFKNVNLIYRQTAPTELNCYIFCFPGPPRSLEQNGEVSTNSSFLGAGLNFNYNNKNLLRRADMFTVTVKGAVESNLDSINQINYIELGGQFSWLVPQIVLPFKLNKMSKYQNAKTRIAFTYNYLQRLNFYTQKQAAANFGYEWNETNKKQHTLFPFTLTFIEYSNISNTFKDRLLENPLLNSSFQQLLIPGLNYNFFYRNHAITNNYNKNYYLKASIDLAGNLIGAANKTYNTITNTNLLFKINQISFSQFAILHHQHVYNWQISKNAAWVSKAEMGVGLPYGNSKVLPNVKQFYAGGANSIRGWRIRTIGPGGYLDTLTNQVFLNQTGDIKLEANTELRFGLWKYFKGVLFVDLGNIWLLKKDTLRPNSEFTFNTFYKQIAIAAGSGIRFDYTFFVIRLDVGMKLLSPVTRASDKWLGNNINFQNKNWRSSNLTYNLAIAYPF
jgi:outer membrane protein insertion porin family